MNKVIRITVAWIMVAVSSLMIFFLSSESGEESGELSSGTLENIVGSFVEDEKVPEVVERFHTPFRKIAHFGVYMLLGFSLSCAFLLTVPLRLIFSYIFAFITGISYALVDEFVFQNFSNGRGPNIVDALIYDGSGVLIGVIIFAVLYTLFTKIILKNRN